jgi:rhodanese-related sulfurtransferase
MVLAVCFAGTAGVAATEPTLASVQKMSIDGLKAQLGNSDVIVIDVRTSHDWEASNTKIKGAVREDFQNIASWINKYPKEKTLVFYCK